jgi:hypothetical protein
LIQQLDCHIDLNSFDHSNKFIRNIDILVDQIGPLSHRTIGRILYMEAMSSVKPEPMQTFYLSKLQAKYCNFHFLKKFGLDPKIAYQPRTIIVDYKTLKILDLAPKKILIDIIEKNINLTKQNK